MKSWIVKNRLIGYGIAQGDPAIRPERRLIYPGLFSGCCYSKEPRVAYIKEPHNDDDVKSFTMEQAQENEG